jgi:hypothetical protein
MNHLIVLGVIVLIAAIVLDQYDSEKRKGV